MNKEDEKLKASLIGQKVLDKIKSKSVKPEPRWKFLLRDYSVWGLVGFALVIGAIAASVVFYMIFENDWEVYQNIENSIFRFVFYTLPYFWILVMILLIIVADYNFKNTKHGYRYRASVVVLSTFILSIAIGFVLHFWGGLGKTIDDTFAEKMPIYEKTFHKMSSRKRMWMNPEKGLLLGKITDVEDAKVPTFFQLEDLSQTLWNVNIAEAKFKDILEIKIGEGIRVAGVNIGENEFKAHIVFPAMDGKWLKPPPEPLFGEVFFPFFGFGKHDHPPLEFACEETVECRVRPEFMMLSSCPFEAMCLDGICETVCVQEVNCESKQDCDCGFDDMRGECLCLNDVCVFVAE